MTTHTCPRPTKLHIYEMRKDLKNRQRSDECSGCAGQRAHNLCTITKAAQGYSYQHLCYIREGGDKPCLPCSLMSALVEDAGCVQGACIPGKWLRGRAVRASICKCWHECIICWECMYVTCLHAWNILDEQHLCTSKTACMRRSIACLHIVRGLRETCCWEACVEQTGLLCALHIVPWNESYRYFRCLGAVQECTQFRLVVAGRHV